MESPITHTFTWAWENSWTNIKIYQDKNLYGHIEGLYDNKVALINGKRFYKERIGRFIKSHFITDPTDNKAYCEYTSDGIHAPAFKYKYQHWDSLFAPIFFLNENNEPALELTFERVSKTNIILNFPSIPQTGTVDVFTENNIELLLYSAFLFYDMFRDAGAL